MKRKYTFLIPAFKARFLDTMLRSIIQQSYTDFKVIISDDCSPEDIYSVVEPYLRDERFSYRKNEENIGAHSVVSHWNLLVNLCNTEYLIMASDDDYYAPTFLEEVDRLTIKYPEVGLIRARIYRVNDNNKILSKDILNDEYESCLEFVHHKFSWSGHIHCMQNNVFKTSTLKAVGGCVDFPLAWYSDDATAIAVSRNGVANTSNPLFYFRCSDIQISSNAQVSKSTARKKVESGLQFTFWIGEFIDSIVFEQNKYNNRLLLELRQNSVRYIGGLAKFYYAHLSLHDYCFLLPKIKKARFVTTKIEQYILLKDWIKTHIH